MKRGLEHCQWGEVGFLCYDYGLELLFFGGFYCSAKSLLPAINFTRFARAGSATSGEQRNARSRYGQSVFAAGTYHSRQDDCLQKFGAVAAMIGFGGLCISYDLEI